MTQPAKGVKVITQTHVAARCETCGAKAEPPDFAKSWGQAHVDRFPRHEVWLETRTIEKDLGG